MTLRATFAIPGAGPHSQESERARAFACRQESPRPASGLGLSGKPLAGIETGSGLGVPAFPSLPPRPAHTSVMPRCGACWRAGHEPDCQLPALPVMSAPANTAADGAEEEKYQANQQDDDADRPQDRYLGDEADDQQNEAKDDHEVLPFTWG